ncbi:acetyl/propionyl/methylcrotonyl-CoA carboxylase subunit alpha [Rhabdaerophilum calidifontis]|uniref:acetyl/propionyl/methylcrotonyl-CoA carboxylase subunit alpha n=1 Tax=Rhabdaerophilum calidifontis TaxID=2604328 RepID=UPI00123849EF|nr:biotin carboxylase N-terminal domain-containing protein [Rhabdaerophilum calidifontis]
MFSSVLIANRGEIALRVARTARRLGMRVIVVHSEADSAAPFVAFADEAYPIGPAPARESYLVAERILDVARRAGAECIHPGYGFLSENAEFAEACAVAGIVFVGPPPSAVRAMGLKDAAKALAEKAGVPVVPGYHGDIQDPAFLREKAYQIGYPVLIKAVAGGGGKGMRRVDKHADFEEALASCQREALNAFSDARVLVEKYITAPRHVEVQVFGDRHGQVLHLFERDCSMQRRHQKVIEEAPAPGMSAETRAAFGRAAVDAARAVGYYGAGTVEFIADGSKGLRPDGFYFMEMNTRLQVEHPVTEMITGLDLVEWQFRVAAGEPLPCRQDQLAIAGHAVEARLYAEEPERGFLPSTGHIHALRLPEGEGIRVDFGVAEGGEVTPYYDPMIAKIIAHGPSRDVALDRLHAALEDTLVAGPKTNLRFLAALIDQPDFRAGRLDTGFIDRNLAALGAEPQPLDPGAVAAGALALLAEEKARLAALAAARSGWAGDPWSAGDGFALAPGRAGALRLAVEGEIVDLATDAAGAAIAAEGLAPERDFTLVTAGDAVHVLDRGRQIRVAVPDPLDVTFEDHGGDAGGIVRAPMHGKLVALFVAEGEPVEKGQRVAIVEAMKMEHPVLAPRAGIVEGIAFAAGAQLGEGARILSIAVAE